MIDRIYKAVQYFSNNQLQGNVSPTEFNIALHNRMLEKYESYFFKLNQFLNRENRRLVTSGFAGVSEKLAEKISHYLTFQEENTFEPSLVTNPNFPPVHRLVTIPDDMRYLDSIVPFGKTRPFEIAQNSKQFNTAIRHPKTTPTEDYPLAIRTQNSYKVVPNTITRVEFAYLRNPIKPNWTYQIIPGSTSEVYNPSDSLHQDVDMHISEESDLTLMVLSSFGINLSNEQLIEYTERNEQQKMNQETAI